MIEIIIAIYRMIKQIVITCYFVDINIRDKKQVGTNDKFVTFPRDTEKENFYSDGIYLSNT